MMSLSMDMESKMAFREKLAWALLATTIGGYVVYWSAVRAITGDAGWDAPIWMLVPPLIGLCVLTTLLAIVGAGAAALSAPKESYAPADERDRDIARGASARAYSVVTIGLGAVIVLTFANLSLLQLVHALVSLLILSEGVRYASEAWSYRRGS
ncbi:DUF2178 domain-containing protein [Sphingomonas japonica]|nr:DUF2178 domain-containing protein [Sphingomonas japonica]